jgi:hypothetical protein
LIETGSGIIAASSGDSGVRRIWLSFRPEDSGFASNPAFPIFVSNAVQWLSQSSSGDDDIAGAPILLSPVKGGWTVTNPSGAQTDGVCDSSESACAFNQTNAAGIYTASNGSRTLIFARNCSPASLALGAQQHVIGESVVKSAIQPGSVKIQSRQGVAGWATAICMALLFGEWLLFHRPLARAPKRTA